MNILVTGSKGFVGKNLVVALKQIKNGNDKTRPNLKIDEIFEYDLDKSDNDLDSYVKKCDFLFNFAGVNRPKDSNFSDNYRFLDKLLSLLEKSNNKCPIMLSSSIQASLEGRYKDSDYGKSKLEAENKLFDFSNKNGNKILVYRFPNLFGKWCRPNYNSAISTFCYNYAHDLPIQVNDPNTELELVYIDDLVNEMLNTLEGKEHKEGKFCKVPVSCNVTLGEIVEKLDVIKNQPNSLIIPEIKDNTFNKKLYSTYLSYLPKDKVIFDLNMNTDDRGHFTELFKSNNVGQVSVNFSKPGVTKGQHFHNSKWEFFVVLKGEALIQERNIDTNELYEFKVSGDKIQAVHMLPGFTHNIINLSDKEELITIMWANELFNEDKPDTYYEEV